MRRSREEIKEYAMYDYIIVNRNFERALTEIRSVIIAERCRTRFMNSTWIEGMI
jgi:guanylate kinase